MSKLTPNVFIKPIALAVAAITASHASAEGLMLEEIVVTAQKRAESLQDVPISVSAMSGEKISEAGVGDMENFSAYIPNFSVKAGTVADTISIRGIQSGNLASLEQSVGTFMDGIYRGRAVQSRFGFLDVGMVEVLRGPQSTLFGKNTIGGALNITSAKPTDVFEAEVSAMYEAQHKESELKTYVSGSLSDTLRGRLALQRTEMDEGWVENSYYDQDEPQTEEWAGRASLEWDASDDLQLTFKYEHGDWDNKGMAFDELVLSSSLISDYARLELEGDTQPGNNKTAIGNNTPGIDYGAANTFEGDSDELALRADYQLPTGMLTAIYGHSSYEFNRNLDADFNPIDGAGFEEDEDFEQSSLEVRFVSELGDGFEYLAGLYYDSNELTTSARTNFNVNPLDADSFAQVVIPSLVSEGLAPNVPTAQAMAGSIGYFTRAADLEQETESWAAFAQGTWDLSDTLRLTLSARYGEEEKEAKQGVHCADWDTQTANDSAANCHTLSLALADFVPHQFNDLQRDEEHWTYSVNMQWDITDDIMGYATLSNGVKSGGFNSFAFSASADEAEFDEETVKSYEIGAKMAFFDGAAEVNVAVFDMDYNDLQASIFTGATGFKVENAAAATVRGLEADGRWQLTQAVMLRGSVGYVDFEFDEYPNAGCTNAQRASLGFVGMFTRPAPGTTIGNASAVDLNGNGATDTCEQNLKGGTNPFTPEWTASLSLEHETDIGNNLYLRTVLDANYMGEHFTAPDNDPISQQDAYTLWNLSITLGSQDENWDVSFVGQNIADKEYITYSTDIPLFAGSQVVSLGREASYAVRGRLRF